MRKEVIGDCTLYLGDAYEIVPTLAKVDSVIMDPPYELSDAPPGDSHFGMSLRKFESESYKAIVQGFDFSIFPMLETICQPFNMFCFCSNKQISKLMTYHEAKQRSVNLLIWHKVNAAPFANGVWASDIEYCIHARDAGSTFQGNAKQKRKVFTHGIVTDKAHPTVKPLPLIMRYMAICSNEGDTILDPFMGSGSTGIAAVKMKRKFIGIEKDKNYFNTACRRIEDEERQHILL